MAALNRKLATHQQSTQYHFDGIQLYGNLRPCLMLLNIKRASQSHNDLDSSSRQSVKFEIIKSWELINCEKLSWR